MSQERMQERRRDLERRLKCRLPEDVWEHIKEEHWESLVLDQLDDIEGYARSYIRLFERQARNKGQEPSSGGPSRSGPITRPRSPANANFESELELGSDYEKAWARAYSATLAAEAAKRPDVRHFREVVLGGKLLTPEEAFDLQDSFAAFVFPFEQFERCGVPVAGHSSRLVRIADDKDRSVRTVEVLVEPSGMIWSRTITNADLVAGELADVHPDDAPLVAGSIIDELNALYVALGNADLWPSVAKRGTVILDFVLSGIVPYVPALIEVRPRDYGDVLHPRVQLSAAPWVSDKSILRALRHLKRRTLGEKARRIEEKNLRMCAFVGEARTRSIDGRGPSWRQLAERWDKDNLNAKGAATRINYCKTRKRLLCADRRAYEALEDEGKRREITLLEKRVPEYQSGVEAINKLLEERGAGDEDLGGLMEAEREMRRRYDRAVSRLADLRRGVGEDGSSRPSDGN